MENKYEDLISVKGVENDLSKRSTSFFRSTAKTLVLAFLIILVFRIFFFESFSITTPSMEGQLLVGDKVWVSKLDYGARLPNVLKIPFLNDNWTPFRILGLHFYTTLFGSYRLPGLGSISHGDIIAFNLPEEERPAIDLKTTYIKRCVAIPGDTVRIENARLFINGDLEKPRTEYQYLYRLRSKTALSKEALNNLGIREVNQIRRKQNMNVSDKFEYFLYANQSLISKIKSRPEFLDIKKDTMPSFYNDLNMYPHYMNCSGNRDNIGPFLVPKKGMTIQLDSINSAVYLPILNKFEGINHLKLDQKGIYQDDKILVSYTFKKDYYFSMGDNRDNSYDSRYWGFIPMDHIIGKVTFIWFSKDGNTGIRWDRIFKKAS